ncbi:hypothetical protein E4N62_37590 [Streptomyces sp. MNU76]|uniref:hypothetical protein n=1 Tax=Streptomyces sp. MNU76 TaxID=2560026 RepID=UPI001E2F4729|nr:hypothetical protein [Streptomyces sp. MNU76]MCC9710458.1 hypothetical protein [Streptomyces sp. MNU76]
MGIESDQVVYEYLSRVGDLAQQRQLPSSTRMRLVSGLRDEIDRRRAKAPVDSPAAVRRIIARLGTPDEVVEAAGGPGDAPEPPAAAVPVQRVTGGDVTAEDTGERAKGLRRVVPRPRSADAVPPVAGGAAPPHLARCTSWARATHSPTGGGSAGAGTRRRHRVRDRGLRAGVRRGCGDSRVAEAAASGEDGRGPGWQGRGQARGRRREGAAASAGAWRKGLLGSGGCRCPGCGPWVGWSNPLLLLAAVLLVAERSWGVWCRWGWGG